MGRKALEVDPAVAASIAAGYDGTTQALDRLVAQHGFKRHQIRRIAIQGGYAPTKSRRSWTEEEDQFLRANWHWLSVEQIATKLDRTTKSVIMERKRLGITRFDDAEMLNIREIEEHTRIDHRLWHDFIERGWLKARAKQRCNGAAPVTRVAINDLKAFLRDHPEVLDVEKLTPYAKSLLEVHCMLTPPRYKLVTCESDSWRDAVKATRIGPKVNHGEIELKDVEHTYTLESCTARGGTDFWVPIFEAHPTCPRCGCIVSRFSSRTLFRDTPPEDAETADMLAEKIGLKLVDGRLHDSGGKEVSSDEILQYMFKRRRMPGRAVRVFQKMLHKGLAVFESSPVDPQQLLEPIVDYDLLPLQQSAFDDFLRTGCVNLEFWPGFGKMYFSAYAFTRLAGEHVMFVHTVMVREQWIKHLRAHCPRVEVKRQWKPNCYRVRVFDRDDVLRCTISFFGYRNEHDFQNDRIVCAGFDESQFLPGNNAHRRALIPCQYRIGMSASPYREDGRSDMVALLTGESVGADWSQAIEEGSLVSVPVTVLLVDDLEHKHRVLEQLCEQDLRTIVFADALEDGKEISARNHIPYVHGESENRLETVVSHRTVCVSRVGDCGIDVEDLQRVIEFSFHGGGRAQSIQRYGRLLHSAHSQEHVVLMTHQEHERFEKRLRVLVQKGFTITVKEAPVVHRRAVVPAVAATWLSALMDTAGRVAA